jgi:mRNA-degrading endonuclease RelE of RelBE toxin-antitoxin system
MAYVVQIRKKALKNLLKLPGSVQQRFKTLLAVLQDSGTSGAMKWQNFSKLGENRYHCHLSYQYVACWTADKETITIEAYYVGSREKAPY